ncbi:sensor histidine kinase [Actinoplanes sp. NPDC049681]|uniref:sensor histidine kinase n=1 Tax=Actinoplanes sp. NPDC049681 TaxID=3363905 RepID=UPI00379C1813
MHGRASAVTQGGRPRRAGGELVMLCFVGGVTFLSWQYVSAAWEPWWLGNDHLLPVIVAAAMAAAALRRRAPVPALFAAAMLAAWLPSTAAALVVTAHRVSGDRPRLRPALALGVAAAVCFAVAVVAAGPQWRPAVAIVGINVVACLIGPGLVQGLLGQRERLVEALRRQTSFLEANHRLAASVARSQERSRIAQEMHDLLGHRLSLISLHAGSLELDAEAAPHAVNEEARVIRGTAQTAMEELHSILGILRSSDTRTNGVQPADRIGTRAEVTEIVEQFRAAGLPVDLVWLGTDLTGIPHPVRHAVHRVAREGLTNVSRYAGGAPTTVVVDHSGDRLRLMVSNGVAPAAFPLPPVRTAGTGWGLAGVRERTRLLGGVFEAGPTRDGGFRLLVELPLRIAATAGPTTEADPTGDVLRPEQVPAVPPPALTLDGRWSRLGMRAVLGLGVIGAVAVVIVTFNSIPVRRADFAAIPVGASRDYLEDLTGGNDPAAEFLAAQLESARPARADFCMYALFHRADSASVDRFCFRGDQLIEKARFPVPTNRTEFRGRNLRT